MSIRINWVKPNTPFDNVRLYRTDKPVDYSNIPVTPLVTLTTETTYLDTTAIAETYYYYTVATVYKGEMVLSPSTLAYQLINSGPGPQTLQCGDFKLGFFGYVSMAELFSAVELVALVPGANSANAFTWCKYIFEGKILFVPNTFVGVVTWANLYSAGMVYGVPGPGPKPAAVSPVPQDKKLTKGDFDFIIRLPTMVDGGNNWVYSAVPAGEHCTLFLSQTTSLNVPPVIKLGQAMATWSTSPSTSFVPFMDTDAGGCAGTSNSSAITRTSSLAITSIGSWRPVLELVK